LVPLRSLQSVLLLRSFISPSVDESLVLLINPI